MKYLLDTHIWIWSVSKVEKLSGKVSRILKNTANEFFLSSISIWEFMILLEKKRIAIDIPFEEWLHIAIDMANIKEIPIDGEIAVESRKIDLPHRDPADRFIAASALVNQLKLITSDRNLSRSREISVIFNKV